MGRINHAGSIHPAVVYSPVANSARACSMEPAVRSTVGKFQSSSTASIFRWNCSSILWQFCRFPQKKVTFLLLSHIQEGAGPNNWYAMWQVLKELQKSLPRLSLCKEPVLQQAMSLLCCRSRVWPWCLPQLLGWVSTREIFSRAITP